MIVYTLFKPVVLKLDSGSRPSFSIYMLCDFEQINLLFCVVVSPVAKDDDTDNKVLFLCLQNGRVPDIKEVFNK